MAKSFLSVRLSGLEDASRQLTDVAPRSANTIMRNVVTDIAREVRDEARKQAPVDEGTLRRAIKSSRRRGRKDKPKASVYIEHGQGAKFDAYYWHFIEFGTVASGDAVRTGEQPYITPAVESVAGNLPRLLREKFASRYEREMARLARRR